MTAHRQRAAENTIKVNHTNEASACEQPTEIKNEKSVTLFSCGLYSHMPTAAFVNTHEVSHLGQSL